MAKEVQTDIPVFLESDPKKKVGTSQLLKGADGIYVTVNISDEAYLKALGGIKVV